ncbi:MAG: sugar transferase [Acidimicrobiales bacterium]
MAVRALKGAPGRHTLAPVLDLTPSLPPLASVLQSRPPVRMGLRRCLVLLDAIALTTAWSLALLRLKPVAPGGRGGLLAVVFLLVPAALAALALQQLYRARVCSVRSLESERLVRTSLLTAVFALALAPVAGTTVTVQDAALGAGLSFLCLRALRTAFGGYLQTRRRRGRFTRPVVLVGANAEAEDLYRLLDQHPELGFEVVGVVGDQRPDGSSIVASYLGTVADTEQAVAATGATGVIVAATAVGTSQLNHLARALTERAVHVHLSSGVRGIAQSRLRAQPMAYEPLFYVEPVRQTAWHHATKRALDIVLGGVGLILAFPVLAAAAVAIKLHDGGPVLFRQVRVGRDGRQFTMLKLRTMVPDSEGQYHRLALTRAGRTGPLVKLSDDPRITRVGRFLRASSIDELPQLLNVLVGTMSMVGPRPNLLIEAAGLDPEFLAQKSRVRPGITGLWQVEGRDNPSFEVYRRLDVFYVENWSLALDASILLATARKVLGRTVRLLLPAGIRDRISAAPSAAIP